jgi:hypothetical protein
MSFESPTGCAAGVYREERVMVEDRGYGRIRDFAICRRLCLESLDC